MIELETIAVRWVWAATAGTLQAPRNSDWRLTTLMGTTLIFAVLYNPGGKSPWNFRTLRSGGRPAGRLGRVASV